MTPCERCRKLGFENPRPAVCNACRARASTPRDWLPLAYGKLPSASLLHPRAVAAGKGTASVLRELRDHVRREEMTEARELLASFGFVWGDGPSIEEDVSAVADALRLFRGADNDNALSEDDAALLARSLRGGR